MTSARSASECPHHVPYESLRTLKSTVPTASSGDSARALHLWRSSVVRPVRLRLTFLDNRTTICAPPTIRETVLGVPRSLSRNIRAAVELFASKASSVLCIAPVGAQADQHTPPSTPVHGNYTTALPTASRHLRHSLPPAGGSPSPRRARRQPTSFRPVHDDRTRAASSTLDAISNSRLPERTR